MSHSKIKSQKRVRFTASDKFRSTLNRRVKQYFETNQISSTDDHRLYFKVFIFILSVTFSYYLVVFTDLPIWCKLIATITFGLSASGIGFNIMHDAGHQAMSSRPWVNRLFFYSLDLLGASSYFWNIKHNQLHHTYVNIHGHDDDIDIGVLMRLSPEQKHFSLHRFQHFYVWFLYCLIMPKWQFFDDFANWTSGRITDQPISRPEGKDILVLILGKIWFITVFFAIPMQIYSPMVVILFYLLASGIEGLTLAVVFQLAHCLEESSFPEPDEKNKMQFDWARHQISTTVDFAPNNKLMTWYVGGLNYQVIHHLFPKISHVHYPKISKIVTEVCEEFNVPYQVHDSFRSALGSHFRHLRRLALQN
jgi:linoleoyl-CoA desaturase